MPPSGLDVRIAGPEEALLSTDRRLVDVVDQLFDKGVALRGELWLTVADVELVFIGLDLVLANPDRMRATREVAS